MKDLLRFLTKLSVGDGCWEWHGTIRGGTSKTGAGYGRFWIEGRLVTAHRWFWELQFGKIPEGLELDHLCRNRGCVRPDHLEVVDRAENVRRVHPDACQRGHPWDGWNTVWQDGVAGKVRVCRTCRIQRARGYRERRRAVAA